MDAKIVAEDGGKLTLGQFRELTKDLPDSTSIVPRYMRPWEIGDNEPGVRLEAFGFDEEDTPRTIALGLSLFYLDEIDGEVEEEEVDDATDS